MTISDIDEQIRLSREKFLSERDEKLRSYPTRLMAVPWTSGPITLLYQPNMTYEMTSYLYHDIGAAREQHAVPDLFIYGYRSLDHFIIIPDNDHGYEIGSRAISSCIKIAHVVKGQKNPNYFPAHSHIFHFVSCGRYSDTATALEQHWGVVLRTLVKLGVRTEDILLKGNNLMIRGKKMGLLGGPRVQGVVYLEQPVSTTFAISISVGINESIPPEIGKVFADDKISIGGLDELIGVVSPGTVLRALQDANPGIFYLVGERSSP